MSAALDKVRETGEPVIATEPDFKPFESKDADGNYAGFDMDLIHAFADDRGVALRIEEMSSPALIPALATRAFFSRVL